MCYRQRKHICEHNYFYNSSISGIDLVIDNQTPSLHRKNKLN